MTAKVEVKVDYESMFSAVLTLLTQILNLIGADEALTDEQKQAYIARIKAAQASVSDWL